MRRASDTSSHGEQPFPRCGRTIFAQFMAHPPEVASEQMYNYVCRYPIPGMDCVIGNPVTRLFNMRHGTSKRHLLHNPNQNYEITGPSSDPELDQVWRHKQRFPLYDIAIDFHGTTDRTYALVHPAATGLVLGMVGRIGLENVILARPRHSAGAARNSMIIEMSVNDPALSIEDMHGILQGFAAGEAFSVPRRLTWYRHTGSMYLPQAEALGLKEDYRQFDCLPDSVAQFGFPTPAFVGSWGPPTESGCVGELLTSVRE